MPKNPVAKVIKELKEFVNERVRYTQMNSLRAMSNAELSSKLGLPENSELIEVIKAKDDVGLGRKLMNMDEFSDSVRKSDKEDENNILHWCVLRNHMHTFNFLVGQGYRSLSENLNNYHLNPLQLAIVVNSDIYISRFNKIPSFSKSGMEFHAEDGRTYTSIFNDLHLAIIYGRHQIVESICNILIDRYIKYDVSILHIGNIMHLFSYAALAIDPANMTDFENLKLCLIAIVNLPKFINGYEVADCLGVSTHNYECLTPIALAAKYGQEAWVEVLTPYYDKAGLHHLVTEAKGLLAITKQEQASALSTTGMFASSPAAAAAAAPVSVTPRFPSSLSKSYK